jgi:hypothetical protein
MANCVSWEDNLVAFTAERSNCDGVIGMVAWGACVSNCELCNQHLFEDIAKTMKTYVEMASSNIFLVETDF